MPLPYQGNPGAFNYMGNPTLVPNFYKGQASPRGTLDYKSPAEFAKLRTGASATATIGGTITAGDTVTMTLTQPQLPGGSISVTYTVLTGDTIQSVAEGLESLLTAAVKALGGASLAVDIYATTGVDTTAHEAVVTVRWSGPMGNLAVLSGAVNGGATETITASGALTGGGGPAFAANNFTYTYRNSTIAFIYGQPYELDTNFLAVLAADDMPVV